MIHKAVETIYIKRVAMKSCSFTLLTDKGKGSKKRGGASFVKLGYNVGPKQKRITVLCLSIQGVGNTSFGATNTIDHALQVYTFPKGCVVLSNHGIDTCGGGTQRDFFL